MANLEKSIDGEFRKLIDGSKFFEYELEHRRDVFDAIWLESLMILIYFIVKTRQILNTYGFLVPINLLTL